jgi:cell division protease FtsH
LNTTAKSILLWAVVVFVCILLWNFYSKLKESSLGPWISFTEFYQHIHDKKIKSVKLATHEAEGEFTNGSKFRVVLPAGSQWDLAKELHGAGVGVEVIPPEQGYSFFTSWMPLIVILGFWIFLMRQMKRPKQ